MQPLGPSAVDRRYSPVPWREIGNGTTSSLVFLSAFSVAGWPLWQAALAGASAWLGWRMLFGTDLTRAEAEEASWDLTPEDVEAILHVAEGSLGRLLGVAAEGGMETGQRRLAEDVASLGGEVVARVRDNRAKAAKARRFLEVYLPELTAAAERYAGMKLRGASDPDGARTKGFTSLLIQAAESCTRQRDALDADDGFSLDVDIESLRRRLAMDTTA